MATWSGWTITAIRFWAWRSTSARPMSPSSSNEVAPTIRVATAEPISKIRSGSRTSSALPVIETPRSSK